jgi:hypothetical protein
VGNTFATNDSPPVAIFLTDDGEDIRGNVYTFDIGFCTHDCSVFAFTNVDVLKINPGTEAAPVWRVASDSGMVLKLVTGPMSFATIDQAFAAEHQLAQALALSMEGTASPTFDGITLELMRSRWCDPLDPFTVEVRSLCPQSAVAPQFASWLEVGRQLTGKNADKGMNLIAALHRYLNNDRDWEQYVGATIVGRGQRDWDGRYMTQVNMPMTLAGYFLYMAKVRLPRTDKGLEDAALEEHDGNASPEQLVTDWFWNSLVASACNNYMLRVFGAETLAERGIAADIRDIDPSGMSYNNLRAVAFLYLIANKALRGALAALSDLAHARQQRSVWRHRPKDARVGDDLAGDECKDMPREGYIYSPEWAEYHESLMDLTGSCFRAALQEVMGCEKFTPGFCRAVAFELRNDVEISVWHRTMKRQLMMLEDPRWDGLFADRKGTWDDLREHRWKPLVIQIARVERAIAEELETFAQWRERCPELAAREYGSPQQRAELPVVDPAAVPAWEGRPERMAAAIPNEEIDAWTYMVERLIHQAPRRFATE